MNKYCYPCVEWHDKWDKFYVLRPERNIFIYEWIQTFDRHVLESYWISITSEFIRIELTKDLLEAEIELLKLHLKQVYEAARPYAFIEAMVECNHELFSNIYLLLKILTVCLLPRIFLVFLHCQFPRTCLPSIKNKGRSGRSYKEFGSISGWNGFANKKGKTEYGMGSKPYGRWVLENWQWRSKRKIERVDISKYLHVHT